jgi:hypothetical protein
MRREIPMIVAFVAGVIIILEFFVPALQNVAAQIQKWFLVVVAFAILVGAFNLLRLNYMKVRHGRADWPFSIVLISGFFGMGLVGLIGGVGEETAFRWLFMNLQYPMASTMFALLAFFVASAAYRAFRARTVDATLLLAAAIVVMLGQVPIGSAWVPPWWPDWLVFLEPDWLKDRIMNIFNTAGQRAILIGASLGVISTSLRILLGIERTYLGEE